MASPLAQMIAQASGSGASPTPFRASVQPTNVVQSYNDYNNAMMQAYAAQVGQQNALWGGLASLGGAAILGPLGGSLGSLLGGAGSAAAGSLVGGPEIGEAAAMLA